MEYWSNEFMPARPLLYHSITPYFRRFLGGRPATSSQFY